MCLTIVFSFPFQKICGVLPEVKSEKNSIINDIREHFQSLYAALQTRYVILWGHYNMVPGIVMQGPPFRLKCSECLSYGIGICGGGVRYGRVYPPSIWGVWRLPVGPKKCLDEFWATRERIVATRIATLFSRICFIFNHNYACFYQAQVLIDKYDEKTKHFSVSRAWKKTWIFISLSVGQAGRTFFSS